MLVKDLMSTNLTTVKPGDPVELAAEIMRAENVGIVPVCDNQKHLLGLITDRDIVIRQGYGKKAEDIMTKELVTIAAKTDVHDAALHFSAHGIRRLPVVEGDKLAGMLSLKDLARKKVFTAEIGHIIYAISNFDNSVK